MRTKDEVIGALLGTIVAAIGVAALAMWITEPPRGPVGAVPSPTAIVQTDIEAERALCTAVRGGAVEPAYLAAVSRRPDVRYSLALAAATGDPTQVGYSCTRAGY